MITGINDDYLTVRCQRDTTGQFKLAGFGALKPDARQPPSVTRKYLNAVIPTIRDQNISFSVHGDLLRSRQQPRLVFSLIYHTTYVSGAVDAPVPHLVNAMHTEIGD